MNLPPPKAFPTAAEYHAKVKRWSSTSLRRYEENPYAAFRRYVKGIWDGDSESNSLRIGSAVNAMLLGLTHQLYVAPVDSRRAKAFRDAELAWPKKLVMTRPEHEFCCAVSDAILDPQTKAAMVAKQLLTAGEGYSEWFHEWTDEASGVNCRCMVDRVAMVAGRPTVVELKTTVDPAPGRFAHSIQQFGYDLQAAFNVSGLDAAMREHELFDDQPPAFVWVCVRNSSPFEVAIYQLGDASYEEAEDRRVALMRQLSEHLKDQTGSTWRAEWERLDDDTIPTIETPRVWRGRRH